MFIADYCSGGDGDGDGDGNMVVGMAMLWVYCDTKEISPMYPCITAYMNVRSSSCVSIASKPFLEMCSVITNTFGTRPHILTQHYAKWKSLH